MFATLLVILFSAGSLVALGSDALNSILIQWDTSHTLNIPSAITLAVTFLMVLAMDMGLIHAAGMLRVLSARRAGYDERWVHIAVMVVVSVLESGTYMYMSFRFEHPMGLAAQALITARALAAPLLAVYLSMAKPLPVTARDMLAYAELASGGGVLRDVVSAANNREIDLSAFASKMRLYAASAVMLPEDRYRLDGMIQAVVDGAEPALVADKPPTGPGTPVASPVRTEDAVEPKSRAPATIRLVAERPHRAAARVTNRSRVRTPPKPGNLEATARQAWALGATSVERMRRATGMSRTAAASWVRTLKEGEAVRAEQNVQQTAQ